MAAIKFIPRTVALDGNSVSEQLPASFFNSENTAHTFIIAATRGGQPLLFPSNGTVNAVFLNERDAVVSITGSIVDGAAVVTLSNPCYELPGRFTLTIDVNGATVYECQSRVKRRSSSTAYDPSGEISVATLSAEIAAMRTATAAANSATTAANTAANAANNVDIDLTPGTDEATITITRASGAQKSQTLRTIGLDEYNIFKAEINTRALALLAEAASPDFRNLYNPASPAMENGKVYLPTGESSSIPSWCCLRIYVPYAMDDRYGPNTISFATGGDTIVNYYTEDGVLISGSRYTRAGRELLTLPQNLSYIIVSTAIANKGTICIIRANEIVTNYIAYSSASMKIPFPTLDEYYLLLDHLDDYFTFSGNLINPTDASEWIAGSFYYGADSTNGHYYYATSPNKNGVRDAASWSRTGLIKVKPNTTYYFSSNQAQIVEYNDRFISVTGHVLAAANAPHSLTTTATTYYIGYSCPTASRSSAYITTDVNFTGGPRKIRPNGKLVLGKTDLDKLLSIYLMQPDELADDDILGSGKTNNLFKQNRVFLPGFFIYYTTFEMLTADNYIQSLLIPVEGGQQYDVSVNVSQGVWLDVYRNFISGFTGNATVTAPENAYYCSLTFRIDYTSTIDFRKHGSVDPDTSSIKYIKDSVRIGTLPELSLPDVMYATVGEEFSVYFRNVTKYSNNIYSAYEYRIAKRQGTSWVGIGGTDQEMVWYSYKIGYTPTSEKTEQFRLQIYDTYNSAVISEKIFSIVSVNTSHIIKTSPTIVTIGDSFTDGYGVSANLYTFLTANGFTPNMIGQNATDLSVKVSDGVYTGPMDDAWSGWGYINVYGSRVGYLRSDRKLSDDEWDSGWGENEANGWTTGQTYSDLTAEQRSHGRTKNQFYNPSTQKFDFAYYMNKYYPSGTHVDYFVSFLGLNDVINSDGYKNQSTFDTLMSWVKHIVNSVHAYDSSIKIILGLVTPQSENDSFCYLYRGLSEKYCKINQEVWNAMMLEEFDGKEAQNIYVMPTHANFDTRFSIRQITKQPCKYKADYTESISYDIHPNAIGSKYIADTARNVILKLSS